MLGVVRKVEQSGDLGIRHRRGDFWIGLQFTKEISTFLPDLHGVALHQAIRILAADALLGQGQQDLLGMDQPAHCFNRIVAAAAIDALEEVAEGN